MNALDLSAIQWRKSTRSGTAGGECVEVADMVGVRDSKDPGGPMLGLGRAAFRPLARDIPGRGGGRVYVRHVFG